MRRFAEGIDARGRAQAEERERPHHAHPDLPAQGRRSGARSTSTSWPARSTRSLDDPALPRELRAKLNPDRPDTTTKEVRRAYNTILTVDRDRPEAAPLQAASSTRRTYGIAIGAAGFDTPSGLFNIQSKQVNPAVARAEPAVGGLLRRARRSPAARRQPAQGALARRQRRGRHPRHGRGVVDRDARVARLHPHARRRGDRAVPPRPARDARPDQVAAAAGTRPRSTTSCESTSQLRRAASPPIARSSSSSS